MMTIKEKTAYIVEENGYKSDPQLIARYYSKHHNISPEVSFSRIVGLIQSGELPTFEGIIRARRFVRSNLDQ